MRKDQIFLSHTLLIASPHYPVCQLHFNHISSGPELRCVQLLWSKLFFFPPHNPLITAVGVQDAGSGVACCLPDKAVPLYCQLLSDKERGRGLGGYLIKQSTVSWSISAS